MPVSAWAAWFQAVGTIAAIYFAGAFARRQHRTDVLFEQARELKSYAAPAERVLRYLQQVVSLVHAFLDDMQDKQLGMAIYRHGELKYLVDVLNKLDTSDLSPEVGVQLARSLEPTNKFPGLILTVYHNPWADKDVHIFKIREALSVVEAAVVEVENRVERWFAEAEAHRHEARILNKSVIIRSIGALRAWRKRFKWPGCERKPKSRGHIEP